SLNPELIWLCSM
ncbi:hypothetical protein D030_0534B, partial [Vibrio parahaemolyticus AQ3810]